MKWGKQIHPERVSVKNRYIRYIVSEEIVDGDVAVTPVTANDIAEQHEIIMLFDIDNVKLC